MENLKENMEELRAWAKQQMIDEKETSDNWHLHVNLIRTIDAIFRYSTASELKRAKDPVAD